MRLLTVTHFFEQHGGGIERVAGHLCRSFRAAGHETLWAASGAAGNISDTVVLPCWNGIESITGLPMPIPGIRALIRLWQAVGTSDGVVIHDALYFTSMAALIAARLQRKPVILIQHVGQVPFRNPFVRGAMSLANRVITRTMLASAHRTCFISATTMAYFNKPRLRKLGRLIFNGVDSNIYYPSTELFTDDHRHALSREFRSFSLFVGRFVEKKGLATIRELARIRPDLFFVLAGKGPIDPEEWELPNVQVRHGLDGAALADLYRTAERLLLPSVGEGFPLVIQEAMACGLPIICGAESAAADPGATSFLRGVTVNPMRPDINAKAFSAAINTYMPNKDELKKMVDYAHCNYNWSIQSTAIIEMIQETR